MWLRDAVRWLALAMLRWSGPAAAAQPDPSGGTEAVLPALSFMLRRRAEDGVDRVVADLEAREATGIAKYGQRLMAWARGRDPLVDWAQEQYDGAMYAVQATMEASDEDLAGGARLPAMLAHRVLMHSLDGAILARRVLDVAAARPRRVLAAPNGPNRGAGASSHAPAYHGGV